LALFSEVLLGEVPLEAEGHGWNWGALWLVLVRILHESGAQLKLFYSDISLLWRRWNALKHPDFTETI
jgi:hypothetical protein